MVESSDRLNTSEVGGRVETPQPLVDFDSSDSPIYLQLITLFRRQIMLGSWPVNERIPTIEALATQFGVANGTIRQSLAFLEREGLIKRIRRRGTFVIKLPDKPEFITLPRSRGDIAILLASLRSRDSRKTQAETGPDGFRTINRAYFRGQLAVMLEHERADPDLFDADRIALMQIADLDPSGFEVRQTVTIGTADTETARKLDIPVNAAVCLVQYRMAERNGRTVLDSEWLMRGDLMNMVEHFATHESNR